MEESRNWLVKQKATQVRPYNPRRLREHFGTSLDAKGVRLMEGWRLAANLPALGTKAAWLQTAGAVGNFDESMIRFATAK